MTNHDKDREVERRRYNERAAAQISLAGIGPHGADAIELSLRAPYLAYEAAIRRMVSPGCKVLDLCGGNGLHSLVAAKCGAIVTVTDISENSLELARLRAAKLGLSIDTVASNAEDLPFPDHQFDLVTCAGGLSYVDLSALLREIKRVLRPGGGVVFVDSLNHNPIYRFNRFLHYLSGHRTYSTLQRMPDRRTLAALRNVFPDLDVSYYGIGTFLVPIVRWVSSEERAARFNDWLDGKLALAQSWAFKIVVQGRLPQQGLESASDRIRSFSAPSSSYRLFRFESGAESGKPLASDNDGVYFRPLGLLLSAAAIPLRLRSITLLWYLACLSRGYVTFPRVYAVFEAGSKGLVHYSFIIPAALHLPDRQREDIEIGPCWTHPSHRRKGHFKRAIQQSIWRFHKTGRSFFMLCREANGPAISGTLSAGLQSFAFCERLPRKLGFPGHRYEVRALDNGGIRNSADHVQS